MHPADAKKFHIFMVDISFLVSFYLLTRSFRLCRFLKFRISAEAKWIHKYLSVYEFSLLHMQIIR